MSRTEVQTAIAVIVSQDADILSLAGDVLRQSNYQVIEAREVPTLQPHLIIYDWSLPLTPEWERQFSRSIVLVILPDNDDHVVNLVLDRGAHEIIRKPLNPRLLALRLRTLSALYQITT
jgi:DNA-binding response OmpR family regulator